MSFTAIQKSYQFFINQVKETGAYKIYDRHSDLIESVAILAITTGQLGSKITKKEPSFFPKLTYIVFESMGLFSLKIAMNGLSKEWHDRKKATTPREQISTGAKIFCQTIAILNITTLFAGTLITACGYPKISKALIDKIRTISLLGLTTQASLHMNKLTLLNDFQQTKSLIKEIKKTDQKTLSSQLYDIIQDKETTPQVSLAQRIKIHLSGPIQRMFKIHKKTPSEKYFDAIAKSLKEQNLQVCVQLALIPIGYVAQWTSTANRNTTTDFIARWIVSALWTGELARQKIFLKNLETLLQTHKSESQDEEHRLGR